MASEHKAPSLRLYWGIWFVLLVLTLVMIGIDTMEGPRVLLVLVLLVAMLVKAGLIGGVFMHLRFERVFLWMSVLVGLLINGAILFGLIAPDGLRIYGMLNP